MDWGSRRVRDSALFDILLEPERTHAELHAAAVTRPESAQLSYDGPCRLLCGNSALLEGGRCNGSSKGQVERRGRRRADEGDPCDDDAFGPGTIREDGRYMCPAYLFEAKSPAESKKPWDYYKLLQSLPADQIWRPLSEGGCPLVKS